MQPTTNKTVKKSSSTAKQTPLRDCTAFGSFSVPDIESVLPFYRDVLGLNVEEENGMGFSLDLANCSYFIYPKKDHQPATFTVLNFNVEDIETTVAALKQAGVEFMSYSGDIETDENNIHREDAVTIAWFKDPCGNILSVVEEESVQH